MSSQWDPSTNKFAASNCIDGDPGPGPSGGPACSFADDGALNPQLNITFPCNTGKALDSVASVEVYNRLDCSYCKDRITKYQLQLIDADGITVAKTFPFETTHDVYVFPGGHVLALTQVWKLLLPSSSPAYR